MRVPAWTKDRVRRAHVVLVLMLVSSLLYLGFVVLGTSVFSNPYRLSLKLPGTGGLFVGSVVTHRGREIGKVAAVELDDQGAVVTMDIKRRYQVPRDLDVDVAWLSPVGEQYVDLLPRSAGGPYLAPGSTIEPAKLTMPKPVADFFLHLDKATAKIKPEDIGVLVDELFTIVNGTGPHFTSLLKSTEKLTDLFEEVEPQSRDLLHKGRIVAQTMADFSAEWKGFTADVNKITAEIGKSDAHFRQLISNGLVLTEEFEKLWPSARLSTESLLRSGTGIANIINNRIPALDAGLRAFPPAGDLIYDLTEGGKLRGRGVFGTSESCRYDMVPLQNPVSMIRTKNNIYGFCPRIDPDMQQRGSYFAPRPPGDDTAIPKRP